MLSQFRKTISAAVSRAACGVIVAVGALFAGAASAAIVQYNNAAQPTFVSALAAGYYQESVWPAGAQTNPYVRTGGSPLFTLSISAPNGIYNAVNALSTNTATDLMTIALTTGAPTAFGARVFASDVSGLPIAGAVTVTVTSNQATASVVITSTAATTLATADFIGFAATGVGEVITSVTFLATQGASPTWPTAAPTYVGRTATPVNGACGTANGVPTGVAPSSNLCSAGTASAVTTAASQYTWTCNGANTGSNASCAAPRTYTVTPSVSGGNGTATIPAGGVVAYNAAGTVTITPNAGFVTATPVGGTCGGTLAGTTYTTNPVVADCTVIASFVAIPLTPTAVVSPTGSGSVTCVGPAAFGGTATCTATARAGYRLTGISGCGGVAGTTSPYTTGAITAACAVTAVFELVPEVPVPTLSTAMLAVLAALGLIVGGLTLRRRSS